MNYDICLLYLYEPSTIQKTKLFILYNDFTVHFNMRHLLLIVPLFREEGGSFTWSGNKQHLHCAL